MASLSPIIRKTHLKRDGSATVYIRLTHERKTCYIPTGYSVGKKGISRDFKLKDPFVYKQCLQLIEDYNNKLNRLGPKASHYCVADLAEYLRGSDEKIDFVMFARTHIDTLNKNGKTKTANGFFTAINAFEDMFEGRGASITDVTATNLKRFEAFLKTERKISRKDRMGKTVATLAKPVTERTIHNYIREIRTLFNKAVDAFNDEDAGVTRIAHNPFRKYKLPTFPDAKKRALTVEQLATIRDHRPTSPREELGRDVFMLSFYLIGMNTVDLYKVDSIDGDRIEYKRSKTKGKRQDEAKISIKICEEAKILIEKYRDETNARLLNFHSRYANPDGFSSAVNKGLKRIFPNHDLTTYYARHSWATIARNDCGISKDDIAEALNHKGSHGVTDIYLKKDWQAIDTANLKVQETLRNFSPE